MFRTILTAAAVAIAIVTAAPALAEMGMAVVPEEGVAPAKLAPCCEEMAKQLREQKARIEAAEKNAADALKKATPPEIVSPESLG